MSKLTPPASAMSAGEQLKKVIADGLRRTRFRRPDRFRHMPWWVRWIRAMMVRPERFRDTIIQRWFGNNLLRRECWSLKPHPAALGIAIGTLLCWLPAFGLQMTLTVLICAVLGGNIPLGVLATWISNPLTMIPLFTANLFLGCAILGEAFPTWSMFAHLSVTEWTSAVLRELFWPMWVGSLAIGIPLSIMTYFAAMGMAYRLRHLHVLGTLRERAEKRRLRSLELRDERLMRLEVKLEAKRERLEEKIDQKIARLEEKRAKLAERQAALRDRSEPTAPSVPDEATEDSGGEDDEPVA